MQVSFSHRARTGGAALAVLCGLSACVTPGGAPSDPSSTAGAAVSAALPAEIEDGVTSVSSSSEGASVPQIAEAPQATSAAGAEPPPLLNATWDARCPQAAVNDRVWDYPDRLRKANIVLKATPGTALRGYLFWSSKTEACLRIDLRTIPEADRSDIGAGHPVLRGKLAFETGLQAIGESRQFDFPEPLLGHVYSLSVPVRCSAATRRECRAVYVDVTHPTEAWGGGITIEVRDGVRP